MRAGIAAQLLQEAPVSLDLQQYSNSHYRKSLNREDNRNTKEVKWIKVSSSDLRRTQNIKHIIQVLCSHWVSALLLSSYPVQLKIVNLSSNVPSRLSTNWFPEDLRGTAQASAVPRLCSSNISAHPFPLYLAHGSVHTTTSHRCRQPFMQSKLSAENSLQLAPRVHKRQG